MTWNRILWCALVVVGLAACGEGEPITLGLNEPFRVANAQFYAGELPGHPPLSAADRSAGKRPIAPHPTPPEVGGRVLAAAEPGFVVQGRSSPDTHSLAFQIHEHGTGFWVIPAGSPDPLNNNELNWRAVLDLGESLPPGLHGLRIAALDEAAEAGTQVELKFCVRSPIPDNLNACRPQEAPPELVVSLAWNNRADLDLRVLSSDGILISENNVKDRNEPLSGHYQGDANRGCTASGQTRENVVWQQKPSAGTYFIYVNLHDSCAEATAQFVVSMHEKRSVRTPEGEPPEFRQRETFRIASQLLSLHANGGSELGTFITEFEVR